MLWLCFLGSALAYNLTKPDGADDPPPPPSDAYQFQLGDSVTANPAASLLPYPLANRFTGSDFLKHFDFFTDPDPTASFVEYVDYWTAQNQNLTYATDEHFIMRADAQQIVSGLGRQSVRLVSRGEWGDGAYIFDVDHLPEGCGTWPAIWTTTRDHWPIGGEIDILEGANSNRTLLEDSSKTQSTAAYFDTNVAVLHTTNGCKLLLNNTQQTGLRESPLCDASQEANRGCGMRNLNGPGQRSTGARFNDNGGGWYAMWRDLQATGTISIFFWERNDTSVPWDVKHAEATGASPELWGQPFANFSVPNCVGRTFFNQHALVLNIAFCSNYTQSTYDFVGCPGECTSFVANNPHAFNNAYFDIKGVRIFADPSKNADESGASILHVSWLGLIISLVYLIYI